MSWTLLVIAGLLEVVWVIGLKYTEGFTRPGPTVITLLGIAVKGLEIGTAYAVWTGIGTVGAALRCWGLCCSVNRPRPCG